MKGTIIYFLLLLSFYFCKVNKEFSESNKLVEGEDAVRLVSKYISVKNGLWQIDLTKEKADSLHVSMDYYNKLMKYIIEVNEELKTTLKDTAVKITYSINNVTLDGNGDTLQTTNTIPVEILNGKSNLIELDLDY